MNKLIFRIKKFFAYRKLKKVVTPALQEPSSKMVPVKDVNALYILAYLVNLVAKKSDAILVVDDEFKNILLQVDDNLKQLKIYTPHELNYVNINHTFVLCTPLSENNFDTIYAKSVLDTDNYYIMLL